MRRITLVGLIAVAAAGAAGYWAGHRQLALPDPATILGATSPAAHAAPVPTGPVVYYRHPDGLPEYAAEPRHTADHRAFVAVRASEDVSFDEQPAAPVAQEASGSTGRRILYYRNPMGLPDTSPVPRKDSMGMDYVPVYEDEAQDDGIVRVSLGKLQRTGVRSELVVRRPVTRAVRLPGTLQLDERRVAVVTTRATAFIEKVENVTTGDRVTKGQPLLRLYSPEIAGAPGPVVAVRDSAVIDSGTRQVVIVDQGDGRFEPRAVKLGRRGGGFVEIRSGVAEGDRVVVAANFLIDAESNLKAALRGLTAPETGQ